MTHPLITKESPHSVAETVDRLQRLLKSKNIQIFTCIDHSRAAKENGLSLSDEQVVVFGDPKVGTYLMQECPAIGIELPLKILIWQEAHQTKIGYREPKLLLSDYTLTEHKGIVEKMSGLMGMLVNEVVKS